MPTLVDVLAAAYIERPLDQLTDEGRAVVRARAVSLLKAVNAAGYVMLPLEPIERLVEVCERDMAGASCAEFGDHEAVATSLSGDSAMTFGHIRDARRALDEALNGKVSHG